MPATVAASSAPCSACGTQLPPGRGQEYGWQSLPDLDFTTRFLADRFPQGASLTAEEYLRLCAELGHEWSSCLQEDLTHNGWFPREERLRLALGMREYIDKPDVWMSYSAWWGLLADLLPPAGGFYLRDGVLTPRPNSPITVYRGSMCDDERAHNLLWAEDPEDAWHSCAGRDELWTAELNPEWLLASFSTPGGGRIWVHDSDEIEPVHRPG